MLYWTSRHWLLVISALIGLYVSLPWLAPLFMAWGWTGAGELIYLVYATQCHQMPQRSFFLFGERTMYSLAEIQSVWQNSNDPLVLRQFVGNPELGWKVAWSVYPRLHETFADAAGRIEVKFQKAELDLH